MSFKYHLNVPATGSHKLMRFEAWAAAHAPTLAYNLPLQAPIKSETLTVRLKSPADRDALSKAFPASLP